ncbi:MAG: DUF1146 domain-containing protein [Bacilli bacterium]|jgi:uncharacterized membrane protein YwzB|nr:DUF1146 family protein [Bacilli bacterium]MDD2681404.1 DUF1146 family protein [Bacilli bacterium]MDD3120912.1 DUF1146 family protein [Bacilli bacterium]MDD4063107.1 DUF1146 family protein [Bacilli bacterium]MDD4481613.1 DUF1146 family protein [Bacilli bacterium]
MNRLILLASIEPILIAIWYLFIFLIISVFVFRALKAIDFSKIFKKSSTWQIRTLVYLISFIAGGVVAELIFRVVEVIANIFG